jgi:tRNA threonylcarbamoyladenosine biosynthesis protein TsaE
VLNALGHQGRVKSPTYALVEPYELDQVTVFHFDLYRLGNPEELEYIGLRDYFEVPGGTRRHICLIEWPERAGRLLPEPDLRISLRAEACERVAQLDAEPPLIATLRDRFVTLKQRA